MIDPASNPAGAPLRSTRRRQQADEWALALASQGLHPTVEVESGRFVLCVPEVEIEASASVLATYDAENRSVPAPPPSAPLDTSPLLHASLLSAGLLGFFLVTGPDRPGVAWFERGSADATRIVDGEVWRAVTALTLHANGPHVVGNAVLGAVFWSAVFRSLGPGLGAALVISAGALGNLLNAYLRAGAFVSIGASTAVFSGVGLLGGLGLVRRLRPGPRGRRAFVPLAAALGLLAMLGTGGEHVDIWAHAFGLAAGVVLGALAGRLLPPRPGAAWQWGAGTAAAVTLLASWMAALS